MPKIITSLEEIIGDKAPQAEKEIREFMLSLLRDGGAHFDVVVGADRKGLRILKEMMAGRPELATCKIMSDNHLGRVALNGARVLVFDDSIHTGQKVLRIVDEVAKQGPKSIAVACLLINREGKERIEARYRGIEVRSCAPTFERYEDQSDRYVTWEMPFLSRLGNRDNPDYPLLKLETSEHDIDALARSMAEILASIAPPKDQGIYELRSSPLSCSVTIDVKPGPAVLPPPYDSISVPDCTKVRCTVVDYGANVEITVMPVINPRYDSSGCQIWSSSPDRCLFTLLKTERSELLCKMCVPVLVNLAFINDNVGAILSKLQEKGVLISSYWVELPHLKRFQD